MNILRRSAFLARLVLAWFVVTVGVSVASPLVKPSPFQMVCSGGLGMVVLLDEQGQPLKSGTALDCPMCLTIAAPPVAITGMSPPEQSLARACGGVEAARIAALVGAPLPARGPPSLLA